MENVKNEGRKATFHRAFDCTRDPYEAIETLIDLGFDRLLTSGQEATAEEGIHLLADLQKKYGNQIEIIAGCGVNENNTQKIIEQNGNQTITQHMQRLGSRCDWNGRESIIPGIR